MIKNALVLFFICAAVLAFYLPSYLKMQDLNEKNLAYEKRISELERENKKLGEERVRLDKDPAYFEKVAREKMGIIKDDEVIYKVVPAGSKKAGAEVSEDEVAILKKNEPVKSAVKAVSASKKKTAAPVKKTTQKKKTSGTIAKSKTPKSKDSTEKTVSTTTNKSK